MRPVDLLDQLTDDLGSGGVGELGELLQVFVRRAPRPGALAGRPDENRSLDGGRDGDELFAADGCLWR